MAKTYSIAKWNETFETADSRKVKTLKWVPLPVDLAANGYQSLIEDHPDKAAAYYGAWCAMLAVAAECPVRGTLASSNGRPFSEKRIASLTHLPESLISEMVAWASSDEVGWLVVEGEDDDSDDKNTKKTNVSGDPRKISRQSPDMPGDPPENLPAISQDAGNFSVLQDRTGQDRTGQDRTLQEGCSEPAAPPSEPPPESTSDEPPEFPEFPTVGRKQGPRRWTLTDQVIRRLQDAYPGVDIVAECRKAFAWTMANPNKRKTAGGMEAFLNRWCEKEQNRCAHARAGPQTFAQQRVANSAKAIEDFANG